MAIYLVVVRQGQCEVCLKQFILHGDETPYKCPLCGSTMWIYGLRTDRASAYIRKGINRERKVLNKGVTSAKRVAWGKKQYRGFKSKEEQEEKRDE